LTISPIIYPVAGVSVGIVGGQTLVDLCYVEDAAAAVDMNLVMNSQGHLIELQGTGEEATFSEEQLGEMLKVGKTAIRHLLDLQSAALSN
jgi:ribonuclease PH